MPSVCPIFVFVPFTSARARSQITSHSRGKSPRLQSDRKEYREFFAARNLVKLLCTRVHFDEIPPEKVDKYFPRQHAAHGHCVADLGRPLSAVITYPDGLIGVSCMPKRHAQRWHGGCLNIIRIFVPNVIYFGSKSSKAFKNFLKLVLCDNNVMAAHHLREISLNGTSQL